MFHFEGFSSQFNMMLLLRTGVSLWLPVLSAFPLSQRLTYMLQAPLVPQVQVQSHPVRSPGARANPSLVSLRVPSYLTLHV